MDHPVQCYVAMCLNLRRVVALLADDGGDELPAEDLVDARVVGVAPQRLQLPPRHRVHAPGVRLLAQLKCRKDISLRLGNVA